MRMDCPVCAAPVELYEPTGMHDRADGQSVALVPCGHEALLYAGKLLPR